VNTANRCHRGTLSIIVPVFNERDTLAQLVGKLPQIADQQQVLIVDDGSTDGTADLVRELGARRDVQALFHECNLGKGAAIRTALRHTASELIVIQDADLEYDPADIKSLIMPLLEDRADVVFGSRFQRESRTDCGNVRRTANRILTLLSNCLCGLRLTDMETGYKAFRREVDQLVFDFASCKLNDPADHHRRSRSDGRPAVGHA